MNHHGIVGGVEIGLLPDGLIDVLHGEHLALGFTEQKQYTVFGGC